MPAEAPTMSKSLSRQVSFLSLNHLMSKELIERVMAQLTTEERLKLACSVKPQNVQALYRHEHDDGKPIAFVCGGYPTRSSQEACHAVLGGLFGPLASGSIINWPYRVLPIKFVLKDIDHGITQFVDFKGVEGQDVMLCIILHKDSLNDSGRYGVYRWSSSDKNRMPVEQDIQGKLARFFFKSFQKCLAGP